MKFSFTPAIIALGLVLTGCGATKKVTYTVDAEMIPVEKLSEINTLVDPVLAPGDLLNIEVTATDMAAVAPFNKGMYIGEDGKIQRITTQTNTLSTNFDVSTDYYLVNANGSIDFPGLGELKVAGLTKQQLAAEIIDSIYPRFIKERPKVDVRLMNFRVIVTGAVKVPGVYTSKNERLNFLEALAMAGDLDIKGDRENILLYRTNAGVLVGLHFDEQPPVLGYLRPRKMKG